MKIIKTKENQEGFVALFTVLITSVVLAMAIGIASISLKEIVLSSAASDGSKAFYAADSGIECALYWERTNTLPDGLLTQLRCNGNSPIPTPFLLLGPDQDPDYFSLEAYNFSISFGENDELCADIAVKRKITSGFYTTLIESKGSNTACDDRTNPKRVERSIRVTY